MLQRPVEPAGVKGYESYANREAAATAVLASAVTGNKSATESKPKMPGYHPSNLAKTSMCSTSRTGTVR